MKQKNAKCLLASLFVFVLFLELLFGQNEHVWAKQGDTLYALEITTGSKGVDAKNLQSIVIEYADTDGKERSYAVFPEDALESSFNKCLESESPQNLVKKEADTAKKARKSCGNEAEIDLTGQKTKFYPYQTQTLLFSPIYKIGKIRSIEIIAGNSSSWEIAGMRLFEVKQDSLGMVGNALVYSFLQPTYTGTLLVEMTETLPMSWGAGCIYTIGLQADGSAAKETSTEIFALKEPEEKQKEYQAYQSDRDEYVLKLDIADEFIDEDYMTGLETLATAVDSKATIDELNIADILFVKIWYQDVYGDKRCAKVPVFSNVLATVQEKKDKLIGLAQKGESLVVSCRLPGFEKLLTDKNMTDNGVEVVYTDEKLGSEFGGLHQNSGNTEFLKHNQTITEDTFALSGVYLYKKSEVDLKTDIKNGEVVNTLQASSQNENASALSPDYYCLSSKPSGISISYGSSQSFTMKDNTTGESTSPKKAVAPVARDVSNLYLVELTTSENGQASTVNDIKIRLYYQTLSGSMESSTNTSKTEKSSNEYSVQEMMTRLYGYWPARRTDPDNLFYHQQTQKGGKLRFLLNLADVNMFTKARISFGADAKDSTDDWQMSSITISKVQSVGPRTAKFNDVTVNWGNYVTKSDRIFERDIRAEKIAYKQEEVLLQSKSAKTIYFSDSKSVTEIKSTELPWDPTATELTYDQACKKLGFADTRMSYTVEVAVAKAAEGDSVNGDSGSKNYFFFRLNFEEGSSAYVLANQQLTADGFRSGQTEQFTVAMNQNLGDLISVDIIPDDTADSSEIFDKLNIANIKVTRSGSDAVSRCWEISRPGWVGINYQDDGKSKDDTSTEKTGRYEGELKKTFAVTNISYSTKLQFLITTNEYDAGTETFTGKVKATINYTDTAGEPQSKSFDLVKQLYYFNQDTPSDKSGYVTSDPKQMFRGNSTDRFFMDFSGLETVNNMVIEVLDSEVKTKWKIGSVSIRTASEIGQMVYNKENEFEYIGRYEDLTDQVKTTKPAYAVDVGGTDINSDSEEKSTVKFTVGFNDNKLPTKTDSSGEIEQNILTKPKTTNDTVNIFMFPEAKEQMVYLSGMSTEFSYRNSFGREYENGVDLMDKGTDCFYKIGISSKNFIFMNRIGFKGTFLAGQKAAYPDHAIVQHVRDGVLLDTCYTDISRLSLTSMKTTNAGNTYESKETQQVALYFGEDTVATELDETTNIAVSIGFKSSLGMDDTEYHSPYRYLTEQEYTQIKKGMIATVDFHIPFLKEITDIKVNKVGDLDATIDGAVVATYTKEKQTTGENTENENEYGNCNGWYTFDIHQKVEQKPAILKASQSNDAMFGKKAPVTVTLQVGEDNLDSDVDLDVDVIYQDISNLEQTKTISGVRQWMVPGSSTDAGKKIKLQFMLEDLKMFKAINLKEVGTDGFSSGGNCSIEKVMIEWNNDGTNHKLEHKVNQTVTSVGCKVKLVNANLYVGASIEKADGTQEMAQDSNSVENMNFLLKQGQKLNIMIRYISKSSTDSYNYTLYRGTKEGAKTVVTVDTQHWPFTESEKSVLQNTATLAAGVYKVLGINTGLLDAGDYVIEIAGVESDQKVEIAFTVEEVTKTDTSASNPPSSPPSELPSNPASEPPSNPASEPPSESANEPPSIPEQTAPTEE